MSSLIHIFRIWWSVCRLGLDELLPANAPAVIRVLLSPAKILANRQTSRAERLKQFFIQRGPIFIKFGQLLSTRPDILDDDLALALNELQDKVPPFSEQQFQNIVETTLGGPIDNFFTAYEQQPIASASLAQVQGATLLNGDKVVIKVLRPNIRAQIMRDLRLLRRLAWLINKLGADGRRLHAPEIIADYHFTLLNELNLRHEAANGQKLRDNFLDNPVNYTPKVYWDYVYENLLITERIDGIPVTDVATITAQGIDLKTLAETGVGIFFTQVFEHNFFHADMHPGNIFVSKEATSAPQYICVDCAIVGSLDEAERHALASMILGVFKRDYRTVAEVQIANGWVAADTPVGAFEAAIRTVCEPIVSRPLSDISFADMLVSLFATARQFDMQMKPSLVLLEKTIVNVEGLGRQLYPELDLWATAQPFLENWLKQRYGIKSLYRQFRQQMPDILEQLPHTPMLMLGALKQLNEQPQQPPAPPKTSRVLSWLGCIACAAAVTTLFVFPNDQPTHNLYLLVLSVAGTIFFAQSITTHR